MTTQIKGPKGKRDWPRVITAGSARVKVYQVIHPSNQSGKAYVLAWATPEGRKTQKFADPSEAIEEGRLKAAQLAAGRIEGASMSRSDRDELQAAKSLSGDVPLLAALHEWLKVRELTKGHGIAAAELWAQRNVATFKRIKVADAIDAFIKGKERAGKQGERTYRSKLNPLAKFFPDRFIDAITPQELTAYLEQYADGVTRNDYRKRAVALWRWCRKNSYIPHGMQLEIENTERADEQKTDIGIISAETYRKLLEHFRAKHPEHLAALVLAGFCGLRSDEIHGKLSDRSKRQSWEDINLARKFLNVTVAKKNTPEWRLVTLLDVAIEWLLLCPNRQGPVCGAGAMVKVRALAGQAKFNLPKNCFRHSWITYMVALTGDKAATATEAGNSVAQIDRRYRRPVPKEEGQALFAIRPGTVGEIIPMGKAAS